MEDPRCPECGEPIGSTAVYCMHCSADLSDRPAVDAADRGTETGTEVAGTATEAAGTRSGSASSREPTASDEGTNNGGAVGTEGALLDPEGLLDDSLTVIVGILGGLVIGVVATVALLFITASVLALLGVVIWLLSTAYLVRRRTVQGAISRAAYGLAIVLVLVPVIPLSPVVETNAAGRATGFFVLLVVVGIPAGILAGIGYAVSLYGPEEAASAAGDGDIVR